MFNYVMTLASVIIGLALAHLMQGIVRLIEDPAKVRIWWVHLVWVAFMIFNSVFWWWFEFELHSLNVWTFAVYVFVLFYAIVTYMSAAVLFPAQMGGFDSYEDYFLARRAWFFGLQIIATLIDPVDTALKGRAHLEAMGLEYWIGLPVTVALAILGIITRRKSVQAAIAVSYLAWLVSIAVRLFFTVP